MAGKMIAELRMQNAEWANHVRMILVSGAAILLCAVAFASTQSVHLLGIALPPVCAFKLITGLDCPGCGLTRALILALHGRLYESYLMHLWGIPLAAFLLIQIPYRAARVVSQCGPLLQCSHQVKRWIIHFVFLSFLLPWCARTAILLVIRFL